MDIFGIGGSTHQLSLRGFAVLLVSLNWILFTSAFAPGVDPRTENQFISKAQAADRPPPPRTMVLRGPSPETELMAGFFAALGLFDVFVAPLNDAAARTAERIELKESDNCRSSDRPISTDSVKLECIRRAPPEPLPDCSLAIDFRDPPGASGMAQRAWIYAVLDKGAPCPFYDSLVPPVPGQSIRPWGGSRLVAQVVSPSPQSILRAIGIEPKTHGR